MKTQDVGRFRILVVMLLLMAGAAPPAARAARGIPLARDDTLGRPVLQAAGRGQPWVNLHDGLSLPAAYGGEEQLARLLASGQAAPLALAAGDFDGDGTPDVLAGYRAPGGGLLVLYRGNVAALFPHAPEAQRQRAAGTVTTAPFLSPVRLFETPSEPTFLATGDFDNDGRLDALLAARGEAALYWLPGDGGGGFGPAGRLPLPGGVTALAAGEINRRDGIADVVVGCSAPPGAEGPEEASVLVFEGPDGALAAQPEVFALPAAAGGLALGQLDEDYPIDLAVAAGNELRIVHGRDRRLAEDDRTRTAVPAAGVDRFSQPYAMVALAAGDFAPEESGYRLELAALADNGTLHVLDPGSASEITRYAGLPALAGSGAGAWPQLIVANVSSIPIDNLLVADPPGRQVRVVVPAEPVITQDEEPDAPRKLAAKPWAVALEAAAEPVAVLSMRLNEDALGDLVVLQPGPAGISVALTAPMMTYTVNSTGIERDGDRMDDRCDTGNKERGFTGVCTLTAAIEEANQGWGADTINFSIGSGRQTIVGAGSPGLYEATTVNGQSQPGFSGAPLITVQQTSLSFEGGNNVVRGLVVNTGPGLNLYFTRKGNNFVEGNYLGTDATGGAGPGADTTGVGSSAPNTAIGGTAGTTPGGGCTGACNLISGGRFGVVLTDHIGLSTATGNRVEGNIIGATAGGTVALGNQDGIYISKSSVKNNTIGGTTPAQRNVISGNTQEAISMAFDPSAILVQGNYIGVTTGGQAGLGNGIGVSLSGASSITLGGTAAGAGNVISANKGDGVRLVLEGTKNNLVQGNYIGVGAQGAGSLGNTGNGVYVLSASGNTIGGVAGGTRMAAALTGPGNVIAGSTGHGVELFGAGVTGNKVQGNHIGVERDGVTARGNGGSGVYLHSGASGNTIGGVEGVTPGSACAGACNIIAHSGGDGVTADDGAANAILSNSIHNNAKLGIDLGGDGWTPNGKTGDPAPNHWQRYPVLQGVATAGATTIVTGTLTGPEGALYRVELFAADACDTNGLMEGKTLLRADEMTIGFTGRVVFVRNLAGAYPRLTATATRIEAGKPADTSEFAPPDISVAGVEITQAIQNLKNEAPLIAGKPTVIRAFLKSQSCDVTQVGAKLTGPPGEILFEEIGTAAALPAEPVRPAFRERGDLARSLEIRTLPQNWQQGPATWTVEANPGCTRPDAECDEANRLEVNGVTFRTTRPMTLAFVPIRITLGGVERTPEAAEYSGYCSAFSLYPMAAGSIRCDTSAKPLGFGGDLGTLAGWSKLVAYLKNYNFFTKDPGPNTHWYGVVDDAVPLGASHILGIGYGDDGTEAAGRVDAHVGAIVLIHEIGHNYNRLHPGCLAGESAGKDGGWPYQPCEFGRSSADGYWGFDYSAWTPIDPTSRADFMSYKTPAWVSDYTYLGIYTKLKTSASLSTGSSAEVRRSDTGGAGPGGMAATGSARPPVTPGGTTGPALAQGAANDGVVSAGQEYLAVSGRINLARGTAAFDPLYHTVESDTAYAPQPGAYTLELSDLSGKTRVSHAFDLADPHLSTAAEAVYFAEILPWDAAAARLRLKRGTAILADRAASAHRPEVRLIYPNGGETLSGDAAVRWTAADADGDSLGFVLQYSHDGGASWQAVALDLWTTGYTVRAGELPGGNNGFFRVLASDGFHTAQDRSDGPFSVERKPPRATILAPVDGGAPEAGAPLTLWGAGSDPETGVLGDAALAWSDNIAGQLGTGGQVVLPLGLPAGWHVLTLTATDGDGMRGTAQARVCVGCPRADLALAMGAAPDPIRAGSRLTYTLATTNAGPADATGVIVTDTLPVEVRFVSAAPSRGTCGLGGGGVLTCSVGALAAGDGATIILSVDVPKPIAVEALYNVAEVIADQADPDRLDNAALVETSVEGATPPTPQNCYLPVLLKRR